MSKQKLFDIINASLSALNKQKIGLLVRETLPQILEMELISESEIKKLTTSDYSKMVEKKSETRIIKPIV